MKKVISLLTAALLIVCVIGVFNGCNKDKVEYTYWEIQAKQAGESKLTHVSELSLGSSSVHIGEIWVNVSDIPENGANITIELYRSSTLKKTVVYKVTAENLKNSKDGWLNAYFDSKIECNKAIVLAEDSMKINEICLIKDDGKLANLSFTQGGVKSSLSDNSGNIYDKATLENLSKSDIAYSQHPAYCIIDEQNKFPIEYIKTKA